MKRAIAVLIFIFPALGSIYAQEFISEGTIEYEVKTNLQRSIGGGLWEDMIKEGLPTFKTSYYTLTFANNKSIYKFDHWEPGRKLPDFIKGQDEELVWYYDFNLDSMNVVKSYAGTKFIVSDAIRKSEWKLDNEYRMIAGFNCRKAVAVLFDSVYIFAFYTEELLLPGGPFAINGLPGTVLGVTIPRLYSSWIATKVMVKDVDTRSIKPVASGRNKIYTYESLNTLLRNRLKDWFSEDDPESVQARERFYWGFFL